MDNSRISRGSANTPTRRGEVGSERNANPPHTPRSPTGEVAIMPVSGTMGNGEYPRPALPPPPPPVERGSAIHRSTLSHPAGGSASADGAPPRPQPRTASPVPRNAAVGLEGGDTPLPAASTPSPAAPRPSQLRPPLSSSSHHHPNTSAHTPSANGRAVSRPASSAPGPRATSAAPTPTVNHSAGRAVSASRPASRRSSSRGRFSEVSGSVSGGGGAAVEELMPLQIPRTRPMERFFVEAHEHVANREAADDATGATRQPRNETELLLERFAEYTDDDSFFSSGSTVIECNPARMVNDSMRGRATQSVHATLQLRQLTNGRVPEETAWSEAQRVPWLYQIHHRSLALQYSSFFIFPARWTPRVVVYNIMHHWLFELILFFVILGYSIFQASWARYTAPRGAMTKPDFALWADVFYTVMYGVELLFRLFATGLILHPRAFLRSPWHWLDTAVLVMMILECTGWQQVWNFTAWRLIRCIKCLTYAPGPMRMKLLAKSLLRSTNKLIQSSIILLYFIFFFGLVGLQLFAGGLHSRCVQQLTGTVTNQICRSVSTGRYWFYWGHACADGFTCVVDAFPNPHYGLRSFDDIGHAMLSAFQIMTFQGWTSLMNDTNDGLAVLSFLYYAFTIIVCTWVVPSLFLGVFLDKIERTSRLFVYKQLNLFDCMLQEQKQRMNATVRLHDYVQRDEEGRITHFPAYASAPKHGGSTDTDSSSRSHEDSRGRAGLQRTHWTDEQRLQLQLSLTRQRGVAEDGERKRLSQFAKTRGVSAGSGGRRSSASTPRAGSGRAASTPRTAAQGADNFALGGRVGVVQHHPSGPAIGASRQTDAPFAARQESESDRLRFLDPYASASQPPTEANLAGATPLRHPLDEGGAQAGLSASGYHPLRGADRGSVAGASRTSASRPPLATSAVLAARESVGVVPNRRAMSVAGSMSRIHSSAHVMGGGGGDGNDSVAPPSQLHASMVAQPQQPYVVHDPEGGDFRYAETCADKVGIMRNIVHMVTEGYPRILTQYLWEHRMMQYRYGLTPLTYSNRYEEAALAKLRRRRAKERAEEREEMRLHGVTPMMDDDEDVDYENASDTSIRETRWMREEGLVAGSMSPIRMAQNITENAPTTLLQGIMYFFILANAVFNASRFDTMPDYWEEGTFIAGVCFSALFTLELLLRLFALGPGPFFFDFFNLVEATFVVLSLFQLGFSRTNTISLFNWVRFLKLFRVVPITPLRRVTRVLIHALPEMAYALIFFSLYMFMWLLLGMSFFGSRIGWIDYSTSDYTTRGNFETFSHAALAVAQAFSVNRDEWLYMSWSGMRVRGGYTVMYFIGTVFIAFVFRFFFIAVLTWAWQAQEEREEYAASSLVTEAAARRTGHRFAHLPWFDFTVWRSFKHIHGGFERRDVAPDEVYHINDDMRRQLRMAAAKERSYKEAYERALLRQRGLLDESDAYRYVGVSGVVGYGNDEDDEDIPVDGPRYVNVGGQLFRQQSLPVTVGGGGGDDVPLLSATPPPRAGARPYPVHPAVGFPSARAEGERATEAPRYGAQTPPRPLDGSHVLSERSRSLVNPLLGSQHSLSPVREGRRAGNAPSVRGGDPVACEASPSVAAQLLKLGRVRDASRVHEAGEAAVDEEDSMDGVCEHLLLPGPRMRYKSVMEDGRRIFDRCLDCNTYKQMPLRAPPGVAQRTADDLHAEHCHMAATRSSRQLVLNALLGYVRMQADHEVAPTKRMVETILGQAWSCGMLLFDTIENLSCSDLPEDQRDWARMLRALEMQQWVLGLHVGEEQVGRATLAYLLAHQQRQEEAVREETYTESFQEYAFFALSPSNPFRRGVSHMVNSWWFEAFTLLIIFSASVCLAVFTPGNDNRDMGGTYNSDKYKALHVLDDIFTVIFTVEMVLKWISMGLILPVGRAYFWHLWNIFDCFIVVISLVSWGKDDVFLRYLKVMRCFRILGPLRFCRWNRSMATIARTIWDSIPTLANVCLIMLMHYIVWCIIFVSMFMNKMNYCSNASIVNRTECLEHPNNTWYPAQRNFRNFYESLLTTFEISTGGEWMDVMYGAVDSWSTQFSPRVNRHPYLGLVFIAYYYISHFVLFSLFIASLIYCYMVARSAMDGALAAGTSREQQLWLRMQNMVLQLKPKVQLLPLANPVSRLLHVVVTSRAFEAFMGLILTFNMVTMALQWYHMSHTQELTLEILQWVFVGIFTLEVLMRLAAHGPRFFSRWAYCWDLLVVCLSYIQIGCNTTVEHRVPLNLNVLRMLRLGRFLNLVNLVTPFDTHLSLFAEILRRSVPGVVNVSLVYALSVYVFAILGMHFLGYTVPYGGYIDAKYNNFGTFVNSLIMVFRLGTLENWATMLRGSLDRGNYCRRANGRCGPTDWAPVYYIPIVLCFFLVMGTLYLAVIVDNYVTVIRMHASVRRLHDLRRFCELWSRRDPNGKLYLTVPQLIDILEELRLPLGLTDRRDRVELLRLLREYDIPDHGGYVYFYEVLMPLARRVMAISFSAENAGEAAADGVAWRVSEGSLGVSASPYAQDPGYRGYSVAEYYAATYVQAAYRRDRAVRDYYIAKSALWRKGRAACAERGLPCERYGFGSCGLTGPDPREEAQQKGYAVPEGCTPGVGPTYADPVNARIAARAAAARRRREAAGEDEDAGGEAALLPVIYQSAIAPEVKKFGPDAPNAIRRHERRSDKLQRRRGTEEHEHSAFEGDGSRAREDAAHAAMNDLVEGSGHGSLPPPPSQSQYPHSAMSGGIGNSPSRPRSSVGPVQPSLRRSMNNLYETNPSSSSYQPPLGTDPEQLRSGSQAQRQTSSRGGLNGSTNGAYEGR